MGLSHSPRIVTDGLVFCVDAGDKMSYPGAGTTWTDLSHNSTNLTLINGVAYGDKGNGSLLFDGTDDYIIGTGTTNLIDIASGFTISFWLNQVTEDRAVGILRIENVANQLSLYITTRPEPAGYLQCTAVKASDGTTAFTSEGGPGGSWPLNKWYHCTFVKNGNAASNLDWYFNGVETLDFGWNYRYRFFASSSTFKDTDGEIKLGDSEIRNRYLNAHIANLQIYNRKLTPDEIKQNYLATKGRYA